MARDLREHLQSILGTAYTIERELGGGGMSRVFVARDTALGREVVIKVLPPDLAGELSAERFRREIQLAARLQHPHIVPVLSAGTGSYRSDSDSTDGLLYYTMPLVEGETLRSRVSREGELPVADVIRIARELSDALAYAHERGVVHRDLKPENILLTRGHALVADFGVAKAVTASVKSGDEPRTFGLTSVGLALGTPAYMAPEQAAADPATDHRADIYALGCVLYELLAGTPPFYGRPTQALLAAHSVEIPEPVARRRPATPAALAALVMRMLEKRPADRPQTADEVCRFLEATATPTTITEGQVVAGAPAITAGNVALPEFSRTTATAPATQRTAWRAGLVGGVVAGVVLVGFAVVAIGGRRASDRESANANSIAIADIEIRGKSSELAVAASAIVQHLNDAVASVEGARIIPASRNEARFTIAGTLQPAGRDSADFRARLIDQTGAVLRLFSPSRIAIADPIAGVEGLQSRIRGALGMVLHPMMGPGALPRTDAPTAEAFAEFAVAMEQGERALAGVTPDYRRLDQQMRRAASLDTGFFLPVVLGATFRIWPGGGQIPREDALLDTLMLNSGNRLSVFERSLVEWTRASIRGDRAATTRAAASLYAAAPVPWARERYARALVDVGRYRPAIILLDSLAPISTADHPNFWSLYTDALHLVGEHSRELAAARRAKSLMPDRQGVRNFEIQALIALDSLEVALRCLDAAMSLPEERDAAGVHPLFTLGVTIAEFRAHDEPARATDLSRRLTAIASTTDIESQPRARRSNIAAALFMAGADSMALAVARDLVTGDTSRFAPATSAAVYGIAAARLGDTAIAQRMMRQLQQRAMARQPFAVGSFITGQARIAAALGRTNEALRLSAEAVIAHGHTFRQLAHYSPEFAALRRNPAFQRLMKPRDN